MHDGLLLLDFQRSCALALNLGLDFDMYFHHSTFNFVEGIKLKKKTVEWSLFSLVNCDALYCPLPSISNLVPAHVYFLLRASICLLLLVSAASVSFTKPSSKPRKATNRIKVVFILGFRLDRSLYNSNNSKSISMLFLLVLLSTNGIT